MPFRTLPIPMPEPERAARILEARTCQLAARGAPAEARPAAPPLLLCAVGAECHGLPLAAMAQVVPFAPCTPAPGQPAAMLGFHGRAGQVFIVLDLGLALGTAPAREGGHLLLLRHAPRRFALRVDRALGAARDLPLVEPGTAAARDGAGGGALAGHVMTPAGLAGPEPRLAGLIDLDRLLRPFLATRTIDPAATGA
jgi:purine-binding chemotaxis protein CheW